MTLSEQIGTDYQNAISNTDEFAKTAVYTKYADGSVSNVSVIQEQLESKDIHNEGRSINDNAVIFTYLEFEPKVYDTILLDGNTWVIDGFSGSDSRYRLEVSKDSINTRKHTSGRFR